MDTFNTKGDFDLTAPVAITITGAAQDTTTIDAGTLDRAFDLRHARGSLRLEHLSITGAVTNAHGGAIRSVGHLDLDHVSITASRGDHGGAVFQDGGSLHLRHVTITDPHANSNGGGAYLKGTQAQIHNTTITAASADNGGGLYVRENSVVTIAGTTIAANEARDEIAVGSGGGLWTENSQVSVTNTTISGNRAGDDGGGLYANTFAGSATVTLTHVTIANNRAKDQGANLRRAGGTLALVNTIVADRVGSGVSCSGTITSLGHNLADEGSCGLSQPGDQTTTFDLAPLGHHGGPTMTHPLVPADPGVDAADVTHSPNTDQRGARRDNASPYANVGTAPDIGAFEAGGFPGQGVPAIAGTLAQGEITYDHLIDGEGRRLETTSTLTADVLRSWWDPLGAPGQLATETDGQGNPIRTYLYGAGLISVLTPFATLGTHQDHLGSITALSNTQGSPQTQRSYGPFGATKTLEVTNPLTIHVPLAFTAGHEDRGGNYHLQARQYDPGTGRFGGLDPLAQGTTDPVVSAYAYVTNRPTVLVDPTGMAGQSGPSGGSGGTAAKVISCASASKMSDDCKRDVPMSVIRRVESLLLSQLSLALTAPKTTGICGTGLASFYGVALGADLCYIDDGGAIFGLNTIVAGLGTPGFGVSGGYFLSNAQHASQVAGWSICIGGTALIAALEGCAGLKTPLPKSVSDITGIVSAYIGGTILQAGIPFEVHGVMARASSSGHCTVRAA